MLCNDTVVGVIKMTEQNCIKGIHWC